MLGDVTTGDTLWSAAHAERAALAEDLTDLTDAQWAQPSLCGRWVIEEVVAHLTAAASIGPLRWFVSVLGARFNFDLHNDRRLAEHRGATPAETLDRFRRVIASTTSAPGPTAAWLARSSCTLRTSVALLASGTRHRWRQSPQSLPSTPAETSRWPAGARSKGCALRRPTVTSPPALAPW